MEELEEYKTPKQLLDFVLTECSDITFSLETLGTMDVLEPLLVLKIKKNFYSDRIFMADFLLKQDLVMVSTH